MTYVLQIKLDEDMPEQIKDYYKSIASSDKNLTRTDSGIDLPVIKDYQFMNFKRDTFNFGIKCQMIKYSESKANCKFAPYFLVPRSSISKTPLIQTNSIGIIDKDYRGNIMAKVLCIMDTDMNNQSLGYTVNEGTRLFQICTNDLSPLQVEIVETLTETERGEGGFGSTGVSV